MQIAKKAVKIGIVLSKKAEFYQITIVNAIKLIRVAIKSIK